MKFSKEEIGLCRKIAEKWRKEIHIGDWYIENNEVKCWYWLGDPNEEEAILKPKEQGNVVPFLSLSDCLEWLRKLKSFRVYFLDVYTGGSMMVCVNYWDRQEKTVIKKGKTPLETCLKAVLAVLEEKS